MATKIRKAIADIERAVEEVEHDIERVVVKFLGHVRHDGKDYHAGDTAEIASEHAAALVKAGAAAPVEPAAPAADSAAEQDPAPDANAAAATPDAPAK